MTESTELAVITTPEQFQTALARLTDRCNVLTPFASIGGLAPQHAIFTTVVNISLDKSAGQVYDGMNDAGRNVLQFLKPGEVALAKNGLRSIAEGLGISIHLEYPSAGQVRHYWHVKAIAAYRGLDGAWVQREASEEWDLRDGSERMRGWTANQTAEARKHGLRQCETRAINAAVRECGCGVKQAYTRAELAKPFVAFRVNFVPNMADADTRKLVTERAMQGASALFAQATPAAAVAHDGDPFAGDDPIEATHVGRGSTTAASAPSTPAPKADEPPTADAVKIARYDEKEFTYQNGAKKGTKGVRFLISDSRGVDYSTFSKTHYDDAVRFKAEDAWVEIVTETNGQYTNIIEIVRAGTQPPLDGLDADMRT
jgi:hypothetical protein